MKFLIHHRVASRDGQAVHLEEMVESLRDLGHEVILVGPSSYQTMEFGGDSGLVSLLKRHLPASCYELLELAYNLRAFTRLHAAVSEHRPDVIYERFSLFVLAGILERKLRGIPLLLEVNGPLFEERTKNDHLSLHALGRFCQGLIWRAADYVLPVTQVLAGTVKKYGVPSGRIVVIPNGINPRRFANVPDTATAQARFGLQGRLVLGFTGFVRKWHRMEHVLDFIAQHGERFNLHLLLVGDGPVRAELEEYARAHGVADRFTVTGVVGRDDIVNHVAAFDIALQPGLPEYASPLKLFEYMYLGRGVVAPDMDNIREVLTDGYDALLFNPEQPASLSAAILRLCEEPDLRQRLGVQARATIEEKGFLWRVNAQRVTALTEAAVAAKRR